MKIFGNDGFRSRFGHNYMTIEFLSAFGFGIIDYYKSKTYNLPILIGRDTRISGDILLQAITQGINESGKKFINLGICPTPAIPFLIKQENLSSGIMISASHNPPEYNGIKIFDHNGQKINKYFENKIQNTKPDLVFEYEENEAIGFLVGRRFSNVKYIVDLIEEKYGVKINIYLNKESNQLEVRFEDRYNNRAAKHINNFFEKKIENYKESKFVTIKAPASNWLKKARMHGKTSNWKTKYYTEDGKLK